MTYAEYREYMKNFFEQYYDKLSQDEINIKLPLGNTAKEMWSDDAEPEKEWKKWKMIPSSVREEQIGELEREIGAKLPLSLKAFLTVYHHYFENPIGRNSLSNPFEGILNAWNPVLVRCGYLPFAWDKDGYFIRCIRLEEMPDEEKCGIYQIDHEILFDFDEETVTQKEIDENMEFVSQNLLTYLDEILNDRDPESVKKAAKNAIVSVLKEKCEIVDYDSLMDRMEEDPDSIYETLRPVQEQYSLTDDDMDGILELLEYEF